MVATLLSALLLFIASTKATIFFIRPMNQTLLLGQDDPLPFVCNYSNVEEPEQSWRVNGTILDDANGDEFRAKEISIRIFSIDTAGVNATTSLLDVNATETNNGTEVVCIVNGEESPPAFLMIQGPLAPPADLTVTTINRTTLRVSWLAPFMLEVNATTLYNVTIAYETGDLLMIMEDISTTEVFFTVPDCQVRKYVVRIAAGFSSLGPGNFSDPVTVLHEFLLVSSLDTSNHFSCETLCDDSLLVTWMINGMFLSQLANQLSVRTETDYPLQCDSGSQGSVTYTSTLQVLSDTDTPLPAPYTVQCVAVATCNHGDETAPCIPEICYSHSINITDIVLVSTSSSSETDGSRVELVMPQNRGQNSAVLGLGCGLGIALVLCVAVIIVISVTSCCRWNLMIRKRVPEDLVETYNENVDYKGLEEYEAKNEVYEQCGDPTVIADMIERDSSADTVLYDTVPAGPSLDSVKQLSASQVTSVSSDPPLTKSINMAPDVYDQPRPHLVVEPCVAYDRVVKRNSH